MNTLTWALGVVGDEISVTFRNASFHTVFTTCMIYRPEYLSSLISISTHTIYLRSTTSYLLHLPSKLNLHATNIRAWHISAPYLWNKLPHNLRSTQSTTSFKSLLKHIYLLLHFPDHFLLSLSINIYNFIYNLY